MEQGCDRSGRYAHLFDPELPLFYDRDADDAPPEVSKTTSNYVAFTRPNELSIDLRAQPVLGAPGESIHETPKAQAEGESGEARAAREAEREPESKPGTAARLNILPCGYQD